MATILWRGDAPAVAQVSTATVTNYDLTTTYAIIINGKTVSVVGSGGTTTTVATALTTALNASTITEFAEITWSSSGAIITGTADTAGKPFTFTTSETTGSGTIGDFAAGTTSKGPNDWSTAANWSAAAIPVDADDVVIQNSAVDILYGLDQTGVDLTSLTVDQSYTGKIGLPRTAGSGTSAYIEYRQAYLIVGATTINVGRGDVGAGSGRIKIDSLAIAATINIYNTGQPADASLGLKSFLWKGTNAANVVNINKGSFGAAVFAGEVATIATLREAYLTSVAGDCDVKLGSGCTLTTINKLGGKLEINSNFVTLTNINGDVTIERAATATTINLYDGTIYYRSTGTATTINQFGGTLDYSRDQQARTVTNYTVYAGSTLKDPSKTATWTNNIIIKGALAEVALDLGYQITLARS